MFCHRGAIKIFRTDKKVLHASRDVGGVHWKVKVIFSISFFDRFELLREQMSGKFNGKFVKFLKSLNMVDF